MNENIALWCHFPWDLIPCPISQDYEIWNYCFFPTASHSLACPRLETLGIRTLKEAVYMVDAFPLEFNDDKDDSLNSLLQRLPRWVCLLARKRERDTQVSPWGSCGHGWRLVMQCSVDRRDVYDKLYNNYIFKFVYSIKCIVTLCLTTQYVLWSRILGKHHVI